MSWFILFIAGCLEIVWAVGLKYTEGFSRLWPSVWTISALVASFVLLGVAMKNLPMGTAYAVWVGIGTVGTVIFGIVVLNEPASLLRITSLLLLISGIVGLKLAS